MAVNNMVARADANALMPEEVAAEIIRDVPKGSLILNRAKRVQMARGQQRMPVLQGLAQAYWLSGDTGLKQTSKEAWGNKYLNAEELAVIVPIPDAVREDADLDIWEAIKPDLIESAGQLIDLAAVFGVGTPASWPSAIVPAAASVGNTLVRGATGGQNLAGDTNALMKLVASDGYTPKGHLADSLLEFDFQGLNDTTGRPVFVQSLQERAGTAALYGRPMTYLDNGAFPAAQAAGAAYEADLITGDWDQVILGMRRDITFTVHTEGVISDSSGTVILNLMQQDSAAIRMVMRVAYQVAAPINRRNAGTWSQTLASGVPYPFGVLRPVGHSGA